MKHVRSLNFRRKSSVGAAGAGTAPVRSAGAVLVRPDRFIAWRAVDSADTAGLERALRSVLDRAEERTGA